MIRAPKITDFHWICFSDRFDKDLITSTNRIKTRCFVCREKLRKRSSLGKEKRVQIARQVAETLTNRNPSPSFPTSPRDPSQKRGIYYDEDQYEHSELEYFTLLGVTSYADITEELLEQAEPKVRLFFRKVLCEGASLNENVKTFKDLIPRSEVQCKEYDSDSSDSSNMQKKKSMKYESSEESTNSSDSGKTVKNVVKNRKHFRWLHEAFMNFAAFVSKIIDIMLGAPVISFFTILSFYIYFFNSSSIKIFVQEFLIGAARGTLKAIHGNKDIDNI